VLSAQFSKLPLSRQKEILDASLREFAEYGYDLASTNRIIGNLGVSKGVLFKYFGSKERLFISVCEYGMCEYEGAIEIRPYSDVFECIKDLGVQKLRWLRERPLTYRLIMRIVKEPHQPVYAQVLERASAVSQKQAKAIESLIPMMGLRPGVSPEQVLSAIVWISQGLQDKYTSTLPDKVEGGFDAYYQKFSQEIDKYFDIVKYGVYEAVRSEKE
jgi:TetR/AcrR family transcriptional regulator